MDYTKSPETFSSPSGGLQSFTAEGGQLDSVIERTAILGVYTVVTVEHHDGGKHVTNAEPRVISFNLVCEKFAVVARIIWTTHAL